MVSAAKVSDIGAGDEQEKKKEERGTCFNGSCVSKSVIGGRVSRAKRNNHKRLRVKESERKRPVNDNTARHHGKRTEKRGKSVWCYKRRKGYHDDVQSIPILPPPSRL